MQPLVTTESPKVINCSAEKKKSAINLNDLDDKIEEICLKTYRESEEECFNNPLEQNKIQDKYKTQPEQNTVLAAEMKNSVQ